MEEENVKRSQKLACHADQDWRDCDLDRADNSAFSPLRIRFCDGRLILSEDYAALSFEG